MKILVSFKRVPDILGSDGEWVVNPFDEIAVEEGLRIKERGEATEIVAVTIGDAAAEEQARSVLAMGVDRTIRVHDDRELDSYAVARILRKVVDAELPSLVLMGKQAVDDDSNQAGQMLAGLMQWPQATFVSKIELEDGGKFARCTRETDSGVEVVRLRLPAVVTVDLRLNEPRYVSLPGLMKARRKPIAIFDAGEPIEPRTRVLSAGPTAKRSAGMRVESVEDLVARLRGSDKVL